MKHTSRVIAVLFLMAAVIAAAGCGSSSSGTPASLEVTGASGNPVNMDGNWTNCKYDSVKQQEQQDLMSLSGASFVWVANMWVGVVTPLGCLESGTPDVIIRATGTMSTGATGTAVWMDGTTPTTAPLGLSNASATAATIHFVTATATPGSSNVATNLNNGSICGGGWTMNVAKDVLSCTDVIASTTQADYWVVDDTGSPLKLYTSGTNTVPWEVDVNSPATK